MPDDDRTTDDAVIRINRPVLSNGFAVEIVRGALFVDGWIIARGGIDSIDIDIDGQYVGAARRGLAEKDAAAAFTGRDANEVDRFSAMVPAWALANGRHRVRVSLRSAAGTRVASEFLVTVRHAAAEGGPTMPRRKMPLGEIRMAERVLSGLAWRPNFVLLVGIGELDAEIAAARSTLVGLRDQAYGAWRAIVLRRGRTVPERAAARLLDGLDDIAERIDIRLDTPAGTLLAELARPAAGSGAPSLVGVLLAGDVLGCDALLEMAVGSGLEPDAEFFYSDERRLSPVSERSEAFFKPQWSPDLLTATNYIGRFWCVLPILLRRVRATMGEWFQFGDYDLVLRCTEATSGICHVPKVLCERGRPLLDHPDQERAALARALRRRGVSGTIEDGAVPGCYRLGRATSPLGLVSIIIPTRAAGGRIKTCIESLRALTNHRDVEIICVADIPPARAAWKTWLETHADMVVACDEPFDRPRYSNLGARRATGEFLLFLSDETEICEPRWLSAMLRHAAREEVGVVGARLLDPDRRVRHAGIFWTPGGGRHAFRGMAESDPGYFGLALATRNVLAVTGACLLVRRGEFEALGGFDDSLAIVNSDVDFCLRCGERGKSVVYAPEATLILHEEPSLPDAFDTDGFIRRWGRKLGAGDPFYHPALSRERDDYAADGEPVELVHPSRPLFDRTRIETILAVKLDHIGDFVTAVPALQRLQRHFPRARVYLLCAPEVGELSELVPGLAGVIEFGFFFPRSASGQRELSETDFATLRRRLQPYRFDLAIDLRKAPDTRPVLQHSGARWLAGFDRNNRFPWLDIVVDWEDDAAGVRKRSHVSEDLLRLADAVADAGETAPALPRRTAGAPANAGSSTPGGRRFVCLHPGVGSPIRRWPAAYYAALVDRLAAAHDVEILLIGSDDEMAIAAAVMAQVQRKDMVRSLVGKSSLGELPQVLAGAALFVGNNSGPQHIAAGLGVPTVGIHSGTVDPREWGPLGSNAVAVRRDMVCSPCYFSDPADCPRELACLTALQPAEVFAICRRLLAIGEGR